MGVVGLGAPDVPQFKNHRPVGPDSAECQNCTRGIEGFVIGTIAELCIAALCVAVGCRRSFAVHAAAFSDWPGIESKWEPESIANSTRAGLVLETDTARSSVDEEFKLNPAALQKLSLSGLPCTSQMGVLTPAKPGRFHRSATPIGVATHAPRCWSMVWVRTGRSSSFLFCTRSDGV